MNDLIRRQDALDAIDSWRRDYPLDLQEPIDDCWNAVRELPAIHLDHTADISKKVCVDTISRRAAIETLRAYFMDNFDYYIEDTRWIDEVLGTVPPAQPDLSEYSDKLWKSAYERGKAEARAEQIRCKDCKYRDPEDKKCDCGHDIRWQLPRHDDWFCADAERRTE